MFDLSKLTSSTADFQKYVEPQLYDSGLFSPQDSYVIVCEGDTDDLRKKMDMYAGIDMCTIDRQNQVIQGIASRIQRGPCWRTFTIRAITDNGSLNTELKKRALAIKNGDMYPTWTVQAYINTDDTDVSKIKCTVGIVRTVELFDYILDNIKDEGINTVAGLVEALDKQPYIGDIDVRQNYSGGAIFVSCNWDRMILKGIDVKILTGLFDKGVI